MPGGKGNIKHEDGKPFSKENQPANRGRPVKVFSSIARDFRERGIEKATDQVVKEAFEFLLALPVSEILELAGNPKIENDMPSLLRLMAKDMMGKNGLAAIKEMLDRAHGKAKSSTDITTNGKDITQNPLDGLSVERQAEIILELRRANANK
jgi:hypothetical protein